MAKTVFIGAGSHFGWTLSEDLLARPALQTGTLALCDLDQGRVDEVAEFARATCRAHGLSTAIIAGTDRRELLAGADVVVLSIAVGGPAYSGEPFCSEIEIPRKYGIDQSVADTIGVGGVFRFLRSAPEILAICHDMEELCPDAWLLNYTNPMAMLCWAISAGSGIRNVGLCHSVQHTCRQLCGYLGISEDGVHHQVGGINHQAWFTSFRQDGEDLYPRLREAMADPEIYTKDTVRFETMKRFGYFVTESTRHMSEYLPYFRRTAELREQFGLESRPANPEPRRGISAERRKRYFAEDGSIIPGKLSPSKEFASGIINAIASDELFRFNGNVMNTGLIPNLPDGCCVEVPCLADRNGISATWFGPVPTGCAALNRTNVNVQELAVAAFLERDRELAWQACAVDPLAASVVPLDRLRDMFEELWAAEGDLLAYYA